MKNLLLIAGALGGVVPALSAPLWPFRTWPFLNVVPGELVGWIAVAGIVFSAWCIHTGYKDSSYLRLLAPLPLLVTAWLASLCFLLGGVLCVRLVLFWVLLALAASLAWLVVGIRRDRP